jgi:MFS transporter, CP family, cyanate transporter
VTATALTPARATRIPTWWVGVAVVLVAANLRPAVVGVSPLLNEIRLSEGLSGTAAGILTALPVLGFGLLAPLAPRLARRFGIERTLLGALVLLFAGFAMRTLDLVPALFLGTAMVGAAIAVGNVLLPGLIKRDFAHRTGLMTGLYTMAISAGGALAAGITVPLERAAGLGWHAALGMWGLFALLALLCWLPQLRTVDRRAGTGGARIGGLWHDAVAWQVTGFMGLQSLGYYAAASWLPAVFISRGADPATAGLLLALASCTGILGAMVTPVLATRYRQQRLLAAGLTAVGALGLFGVLAVPGAAVASMAVLGLAQGAALGLAMTYMAVRAPDAMHAAQLSGMAQSVGYTVAAAGPFVMGALHDLTGGWTVPLVVLLVLFVPQGIVGVLAGRDRLGQARHSPRVGV